MNDSIQSQIVQAANQQGVPAALALAIANQESGFNQGARGAAGEVGVFQLLPSTAAGLGVNPYDLSQNIAGGIAYISQMLAQFGGNVAMAVAAYNAGPGAVSSGRIPASTQSYVANVLGALGAGAKPPIGSATPRMSSPTEPLVPGDLLSAILAPAIAPQSRAVSGLLLLAAGAVLVALII